MHIWVDADACPQVMKTILFRAAERVGMSLSLVANRRLHVPRSPYLHAISVRGGPDAADDHIVEQMGPGDLVITADIPLAARVVEKEGTALNPRGELYTEDNVSERLSVRDFMHDLRDSGVRTGGPAALSSAHKQAFANQLDKWLAQNAPKNKN